MGVVGSMDRDMGMEEGEDEDVGVVEDEDVGLGGGRRHGRGRAQEGEGAWRGRGRGHGHGSGTSRQLSPDEILHGPWKKEESSGYRYTFTGGEAGPTTPVDDRLSAVDLFSRFFTEAVWELLVVETNHYAAKVRQDDAMHMQGRGLM